MTLLHRQPVGFKVSQRVFPTENEHIPLKVDGWKLKCPFQNDASFRVTCYLFWGCNVFLLKIKKCRRKKHQRSPQEQRAIGSRATLRCYAGTERIVKKRQGATSSRISQRWVSYQGLNRCFRVLQGLGFVRVFRVGSLGFFFAETQRCFVDVFKPRKKIGGDNGNMESNLTSFILKWVEKQLLGFRIRISTKRVDSKSSFFFADVRLVVK